MEPPIDESENNPVNEARRELIPLLQGIIWHYANRPRQWRLERTCTLKLDDEDKLAIDLEAHYHPGDKVECDLQTLRFLQEQFENERHPLDLLLAELFKCVVDATTHIAEVFPVEKPHPGKSAHLMLSDQGELIAVCADTDLVLADVRHNIWRANYYRKILLQSAGSEKPLDSHNKAASTPKVSNDAAYSPRFVWNSPKIDLVELFFALKDKGYLVSRQDKPIYDLLVGSFNDFQSNQLTVDDLRSTKRDIKNRVANSPRRPFSKWIAEMPSAPQMKSTQKD